MTDRPKDIVEHNGNPGTVREHSLFFKYLQGVSEPVDWLRVFGARLSSVTYAWTRLMEDRDVVWEWPDLRACFPCFKGYLPNCNITTDTAHDLPMEKYSEKRENICFFFLFFLFFFWGGGGGGGGVARRQKRQVGKNNPWCVGCSVGGEMFRELVVSQNVTLV